MFTRLYIEAILRDEDAADLVWEAWHSGQLTDAQAASQWALIAFAGEDRPTPIQAPAGIGWANSHPGNRVITELVTTLKNKRVALLRANIVPALTDYCHGMSVPFSLVSIRSSG